jgi:hypothetical protein
LYARLARYRIEPERCHDALEAFREAGVELAALDGFADGWVAVDSESGEILTVTMWDSIAAFDASELRATTLRQKAMRAVDGGVEGVSRYDVAIRLGADGEEGEGAGAKADSPAITT